MSQPQAFSPISNSFPSFRRFLTITTCPSAQENNKLAKAHASHSLKSSITYWIVFLEQGKILEERSVVNKHEIWDNVNQIGEGCYIIVYDLNHFEPIASELYPMLVDVQSLARILMPGMQSYDLRTIATVLRYEDEKDINLSYQLGATLWVFGKLLEILLHTSKETILRLARLSNGIRTPLEQIFTDALTQNEFNSASMFLSDGNDNNNLSNFQAHTIGRGSCELGEETKKPRPLIVEDLADMLDEGGLFDGKIDYFEPREQQITMVRMVADAFNKGKVLLVEAGTGTGKSLSYLTPALQWAVQNKQRVIVSTNTKNLQEQLYYKDLPLLMENSGLDFRATLLKGRSNYLCLDRWHQVTSRPEDYLNSQEKEAAISLVVWARQTQTGDISEYEGFTKGATRSLWEKINGEGTACPKCLFKHECFVNRIRSAATKSHVIIINHALLLSDLQTEHSVLSQYNHLIIDEAHNLERAAIQHFTIEVSGRSIKEILNKIYDPERRETGGLAILKKMVPKEAKNQEQIVGVINSTKISIGRVMIMREAVENFFHLATHEASKQFPESSQYSKLRYQQGDKYANILNSSGPILIGACLSLREALSTLHEALSFLPDSWLEDRDSHVGSVQSGIEACRAIENNLGLLTKMEDDKMVYWVEASKINPVSCTLTGAPLTIAKQLHDDLFSIMRTTILTSATLTVGGGFDYYLEKLGLDRIAKSRLKVESVGSPFDYEDQILVCVPDKFPKPSSQSFQAETSQVILDLVVSTKRNMLVLFTSYNLLNQTFEDLKVPLAEYGVSVMAQGTSGSRSALLKRFQEAKTALLLGTDSFWEGIDVPGKALEIVVLVKLPFSVPTDPVVQARIEQLDKTGRNGFLEFQVPEAVIKFRQGIGRLIRTTRDYGVIAILDQRIISTTYGSLFLDSLPVRPEIYPDGENLVEGVTYWFRAREKRNLR